MNIHLAGIEGKGILDFTNREHNNYLVTFAFFVRSKSNPDRVDKMVDDLFTYCGGKRIMLDSGAFSRSTGVIDFSLQDYIDFLHKHGSKFCAYVTLDIPMQGIVSQEYIDYSIRVTDENTKALEEAGLTPVPVYQRRWNRLDILEDYLEKYEYVFLGGSSSGNAISRKQMFEYLDIVFKINSKYKRKFHGLGQTADEVLKTYPWYSVDSTSWLNGTKTGSVYAQDMMKYKGYDIDFSSFKTKLFPPDFYDHFPEKGKLNYNNRLIYSIDFYTKYEQILTDLWKIRGVEWND